MTKLNFEVADSGIGMETFLIILNCLLQTIAANYSVMSVNPAILYNYLFINISSITYICLLFI